MKRATGNMNLEQAVVELLIAFKGSACANSCCEAAQLRSSTQSLVRRC